MTKKTNSIDLKPLQNAPWVLAILPMRIGSTRIKTKMSQMIGSQSLAERSLERALTAFKNTSQVCVCIAVDDLKLAQTLEKKFPAAKVILTSPEIPTGTDRVFTASIEFLKSIPQEQQKNLKGVLNIQGDMPFMDPEGLKKIADFFLESDETTLNQFPMATLAQEWPTDQNYKEKSAVKVISNRQGGAIYFSRLPIPYGREKIPTPKKQIDNSPLRQLHLGVYGYTPQALARFCAQAPTHLELAEGLEQLRALYLGLQILVIPIDTNSKFSWRGIDVPADLSWAKRQASRLGKFSKTKS